MMPALLPCKFVLCLKFCLVNLTCFTLDICLLKLSADASFLHADQLNAPAAKSESSINIPDKDMVRVC